MSAHDPIQEEPPRWYGIVLVVAAQVLVIVAAIVFAHAIDPSSHEARLTSQGQP